MDDHLNVQKLSKPKDDLIERAARFGAFGWVAFFMLLILFITQNVIFMLSPKQVMATVDGKVVGQVIFDEARIRSNDTIVIDVKTWVQHCSSINKHTVLEDLTICLQHMEAGLSEERLRFWEEQNYVPIIKNAGCDKTSIEFDDNQTSIIRDSLQLSAQVKVTGSVICIQNNGEPLGQTFIWTVDVQLIPRDTNFPLGISIIDYQD